MVDALVNVVVPVGDMKRATAREEEKSDPRPLSSLHRSSRLFGWRVSRM
jgi:hypothetical protein